MASSIEQASALLRRLGSRARVVAGGTDLLLELDRGARPGVDTLIDITRVPGSAEITADAERVWIGSGVTHRQVVQSDLCGTDLTPLAQACLEVGSPQLRNTATIVGNVVTASPANDTISALLALGAVVEIVSDGARRSVPLEAFITGFRSVDLRPAELVDRIGVRRLRDTEAAMFAKSGLRRAQAISVVHLAARLKLDDGLVEDLVVAVGSVGPTVVMLDGLGEAARGRRLDDETIAGIAAEASAAVGPIDDIRATADYRRRVLDVMIRRVLASLRDRRQLATWPAHPPCLSSKAPDPAQTASNEPDGAPAEVQAPPLARSPGSADPISVLVNDTWCTGGREPDATLLDWLRTHAGTRGVKEGCAEGECGACTVICDGRAVLSCLVPAPRMDGATVRTVEGLASESGLSRIQQAFLDRGAVQCGFCTPGFIVAATALLDEVRSPTTEQVLDGLAGNLCRCTGYDSIMRAVEVAAAAGP